MAIATAAEQGGTTKKTVVVVAYAEHDAFKSERAMADALDPSRDYYERDYQRSRTVELVATDDEGEVINREKVYCSDIKDALVEGGVGSPNLTVNEEVETSRPRKYSPSGVVSDLRDDLADDMPETLTGGVEQAKWWNYQWQDAESRTLARIRAGDLDYRKVLLHRTERNGRAKYEGRRKHLSMEFTIELGPAAEETVEARNDELVAEFVKELAHVDWVHKVRVSDCTETVEREGDCFEV